MSSYPLEIHHIANEADEHDADNAGLDMPESTDSCEHCLAQVGRARGLFAPYVIVLNQNDDLWFVCETCAVPVLDLGDEK